jgi:predicted metal-dependent HD superfamily phosphohydrolase
MQSLGHTKRLSLRKKLMIYYMWSKIAQENGYNNPTKYFPALIAVYFIPSQWYSILFKVSFFLGQV